MRQEISSTQRRVRITIWVVGILFVVGNIVGGMLRPLAKRSRSADMGGQPIQTAMAIVEAQHGMDRAEMGKEMIPWALVRFEGKLYKAQATMDSKLKDGDTVLINYIRGHSGAVYLLSAESVKKNANGSIPNPTQPATNP
jgi:hypothetical protein